MTGVHLVFLFVYVFGAFAYASAALLWLRQASPVWAPYRRYVRESGRGDLVNPALFALCTVWFVLNGVSEFRLLAGATRESWVDILILVLLFGFPPLIMHVVYQETSVAGDGALPRLWRRLLTAMYLVSPLVGLYVFSIIFGWPGRPPAPEMVVGLCIGALFVAASIYNTVLMTRRQRTARTLDERRLRRVMILLFAVVSALVVMSAFMADREVLADLVSQLMRATPLAFLIASVYFENRFDFYDMVVKRGVMLALTILVMGLVFMVALPWMDRLPAGAARPWMAAAAVVPVALVLPWVYARLALVMDRLWFGRAFTPVEAVKHVLAAMQPAADEPSLVDETERRLTEIFGAPIRVVLDAPARLDRHEVDAEVTSSSPVSGTLVRMVVVRTPGARALLSEDLLLLRSLASVFGFMLENVRLQHRRLEQEQVAQALRLQSSRSELKALRAQINPHFLFNALNAIASLIHTDPARADTAVEQLAEVFRYTLRRSDSEWAPVDQEVAFAQAYLDVEQARFGSRLTFSIEADPALAGVHVPSMLLQTLVENAVKHGISRLRGQGHVSVAARVHAGRVTLEVRDTGPGPDAALSAARRPEGESFGLRSVRDRLAGHFGDRAALTLTRDAAAGVTIARIEMPLQEARA